MRAKDKYLALTGYRLPTEAEWEFACRAGTITRFYFGQSDALLANYAWYQVNSGDHTWPVASLKPNDFGLFDMLGNVWQWCECPPRTIRSRSGASTTVERREGHQRHARRAPRRGVQQYAGARPCRISRALQTRRSPKDLASGRSRTVDF